LYYIYFNISIHRVKRCWDAGVIVCLYTLRNAQAVLCCVNYTKRI